jgi:alkanesulfonate monooxygenase SsuD/methylene tetrahydromethanopterin reductase-like flavin-dependent oxidoreductase (luciferase family)
MHIGVVLPQRTDWKDARDAALHAEELGCDSIWVVDHLLSTQPDKGILEGWTLMSALAATTERVEIGAQVLCQSFRSPGLLAKMATTLDRVSGGRLRFMIGAGWYAGEYTAFGYDFPSPGVRIDELTDAVQILKGLLAGPDPFTYEGKHHVVHEAINAPPPIRAPLPIEIGGIGDRLLRLVAKHGDGWNCPGTFLSRLEERLQFLSKACEESERRLSDLKITVQIACAIEEPDLAQHPVVQIFGGDDALVGSISDVVDKLGRYRDVGVEGVHVVLPPGDAGARSLDRLVGDVAPQI